MKLTCLPKTSGVEQEYWHSLSYLPSTARAGWDKIKVKVQDRQTQLSNAKSLGEVTM